MDELLTSYLAAADNSDWETANRLLEQMDAMATLKIEDTKAKLDELADGLLGLFEATNELVAEYA
jgi:hypothetical protein